VAAGPNAVTSAVTPAGTRLYSYDANGNLICSNAADGSLSALYDAFNLPLSLARNSQSISYGYGSDNQRFRQTAGSTSTIYIDKLYERVKTGGQTEHKFYIGDYAIVEGDGSIRYLHRDRLNSILAITDEDGVEPQSTARKFDPFGRPQEVDMSSGNGLLKGASETPRGFTQHEHLNSIALIHMNGRAYDYNLGRFLSVDPVIQFPANSQSLNPYSYILNNPLSGTDPSGYVACSASDGSSGNCGVTWEGEGDTRSINKTSNRTGTFNTSYTATSTADANIVRTQTGGKSQTFVLNNGSSTTATVAGSDNPNKVGSPAENGKTSEGNRRAVSSETFFALNEREQQGYFDQLIGGTPQFFGSDSASQLAGEPIGRFFPGTHTGNRAAEYWAEQLVNSGGKFWNNPGAGLGLFFSVLWTPELAGDTALTLGTAGLGSVSYFSRIGYYRFVGPNSNPASSWVVASTTSAQPYASMSAAKSSLQMPFMPTSYKAVSVPWYKPVVGPRTVWKNPQWGAGGGKEWYQGWKFPKD
jgi:RHS repeat-associated protein